MQLIYKYFLSQHMIKQDKSWTIPFEQDLIKEFQPSYSHKQLEQLLTEDQFNYGLGCIMGSCIGDALGSYCQFQPKLSDQHMDRVMKMDGGGTFSTQPGQLTDDTQLARHLINALANNYDKSKPVEEQTNKLIVEIAAGYAKWFQSQPFDRGTTCSKAFRILVQQNLKQKTSELTNAQLEPIIKELLQSISNMNRNSQSNGSLMRIAPMGFFTAIVKDGKNGCQALIRKQIGLTHSHQNAAQSAYYWVKMLRRLITRNEKTKNLKDILEKTKKESKVLLPDWIEESQNKQLMEATQNMGWLKIAWTMGLNRFQYFCQLNEEQLTSKLFSETMRKVIQKGGDSDTNAAIVGGLTGAVVGFKQLPAEYLKKMMNLKFEQKLKTKLYTNRPHFYQPRMMIVDAIKLYKKAKKQ